MNNRNEILKKKLLAKMKEKNLSIASLERKAGLKVHAIRNFTLGRSKKPNIENLQAAAKVLECSVEEFFNDYEEETNPINLLIQNFKTKKTMPLRNIHLFENVVDLILKICKHKNYTPSMEQATFIIKEVYNFSDKDQGDQPDENFAEWIITKGMDMNKI